MIEHPVAADIIDIASIGVDRVACVDRDPFPIGAPHGEQRYEQHAAIRPVKRKEILALEAVLLHCGGNLFGKRLDLGKGPLLTRDRVDDRRPARLAVMAAVKIVDSAHCRHPAPDDLYATLTAEKRRTSTGWQ